MTTIRFLEREQVVEARKVVASQLSRLLTGFAAVQILASLFPFSRKKISWRLSLLSPAAIQNFHSGSFYWPRALYIYIYIYIAVAISNRPRHIRR